MRVAASLAICITLTVLPLLSAPILKASGDSLQGIAQALPCGTIGGTEDVSPGEDLYRIDIDLSSYPSAVCNDGTPAAMFVRRYGSKKDKNKWIIFLLGGGDCGRGQSCAERWCSINTNYGEDKMSTSFLNERSISGSGIFSPDSSINNFAGWNQVFVYYCSSDNWAGSASNVHLSAVDSNGRQVDYLINFRGADIVDAVIGTLQREPDAQPVAYTDSQGVERIMPDLDKAEVVLFTGSSAGGNGVKNNVDRVGDLLRKTNKQCRRSKTCALVYLGVIDANYPPSYHSLDLAQSAFCTQPPNLCTYQDYYRDEWNQVNLATWNALGDQSCVEWHQTHLPGTEWNCADPQHVVNNHLTTPLFIRQDLQDRTWENIFQQQGLAGPPQFGQLVQEQLRNVVNLDSFAEEGSVKNGGRQLSAPGVFGPQCTQHYGLSVNDAFYDVKIALSSKPYSYHDLLWNWVQGMQPQQAVHAFVSPGPAQDCP